MIDVMLRTQKDRLMTPMVQYMSTAIHPNVISFIALGVGLLSASAVMSQAYIVGLILWLLNRILDGLDGVVARVHHKQSDFGGYLDLLLDFIVYLAIPVAFIYAMPTTENFWAGIALLTVYVINLLSWSTLSALLEKRQLQTHKRLTSLEMPTGLIEGAETIVFYILFYLLPNYVAYIFVTMSILVLYTAGQRVWWAYKKL